MSSAAASSSGNSAVSGLGITFHPSPIVPHAQHQQQDGRDFHQHIAQQQPYAQPRSLQHSISYDDGLNGRVTMDRYSQPMIKGDSSDSNGQRRVRIAAGTPEVLGKEQHHGMYQQQHHQLSPLSEFEHSSESDSAFDYSPASLSSLPSSTNSGAGPYAHQFPQPGQLRHAQSMQEIHYNPYAYHYSAPPMEYTHSQPFAPQPQYQPQQYTSYHRPHPVHEEEEEEPTPAPAPAPTPSRLPAFLQDRRRQPSLARPKSMLELGQLQALQSIEQRSQAPELIHSYHYGGATSSQGHQAPEEEESDDDRYGVGSPSESVPSSAGGLQRRNLERQLQQQHRFYQEEKERLHKSAAERHVPSYPSEMRQASRMRSRSMCATDRIPRPSSREDEEEEGQTAEETEQERPRATRPKSEVVAMRSQASMKGLEPAETGGSFVALDRDGYAEGEGISPHETSESMRNGEETVIRDEDVVADSSSTKAGSTTSSANSGLARHSTLLTVGANPSRRSKELDRLLAPSGKNSALPPPLPTIADSPTPSSSSAATASTRQRASSHASSRPSTLAVVTSPVMLEQGKAASKARVELDVVLESSLVVVGGTLKGRMEVRVRKPKFSESEVWVGRPKVRVVGFEELSSQDARHIFYHHASTISSLEGTTKAPNSPLPCFDSAADVEGFHKARIGQHTVPFSMHLPIGKGAKGGWKGKQGVVRYIVIGSIKLKSANGKDRSIAHFYRHVEIYPYFNPAVLLAPALKPLVASAAKGLFMGGSGKVNLSAKMHRANWVAGQRCYVEIRVENESSKKIKSLTLSLVRTTTIFRPRPYLDAGSGYDGKSPDGDIDADACHTQTTRKKVAESTLEMGKKGSKGVTAKGNWMGVEGGESADFSHFLLVPPDALSIPRGRHVEVTYAIKVSVGGSLSADVCADLPIRVVNFLSLDPPPGHSGDISTTNVPSRTLAKSWSIDQLQGAGVTRAETLRRQPHARMASMDSLRLEDLNIGRGNTRVGVAPALSRVASADSIRTTDLSRAQSVVEANDVASVGSKASMMAPLPPLPRDQVVVGKALERQLTHRMSLECITSAIASATARREGRSPTKSTLRSVASSAEIEQWEEQGEENGYFGGGGERLYDGAYEPFQDMGAEQQMADLQLDDLDDVPDDQAYFDGRTQDPLTLDGPLVVEEQQEMEEDSDDELELDAVMQSRFSDDEDDEEPNVDRQILMPPPPSPRRAQASARSPVTRSRPTSPVKQEAPMPKSAMKRSDKFAFATPTSPVKANVDLPVPQSPVRRQPSRTEMAPPRSVPRPLPPRPTGAPAFSSPTKASAAREQAGASTRLELNKKPSVSSLKRSPGVIRKASSKSLREATSPTLSTGNTSDAPELDSSSAKSSPEIDAAPTPSQPASARTSPTISITSSPRLAPSSPRKVKAAPTTTLRAARSMHDLRTPAPAPPPQRRPTTVLPSVKSKIAALETRQAALHRLSGAKTGGGNDLARANSVTSEYSDASFNLTDLGRANSMASFKAPLLRRKVQPVPEMPQL